DSAGGFRVQFGAFSQEENARRLQAAIAATGLKVEVSHDQGASGHPLFFVRSPAYTDRASALSAAQGAQIRAQHLTNAIPIQYTIIADHPAPALHAQR
ncbi:MAG TPA: SPOR domain-containing protein, partial [Stellaceae bacterium]|nr:SPOR domain-containing protein [Stellaceae bacterium]